MNADTDHIQYTNNERK